MRRYGIAALRGRLVRPTPAEAALARRREVLDAQAQHREAVLALARTHRAVLAAQRGER